MTLEKTLAGRFMKAVPTLTHIKRIENGCDKGTPDVNGCLRGRDFWVELKVGEIPKRASTMLKVRHFTKEQRRWLFDRAQAGGTCYLLLQLEKEYFLLEGENAAVFVGHVSMLALREIAVLVSKDLGEVAHAAANGKKSS